MGPRRRTTTTSQEAGEFLCRLRNLEETEERLILALFRNQGAPPPQLNGLERFEDVPNSVGGESESRQKPIIPL